METDEKPVLAVQDLSDEDRIRYAIIEFYEVANSISKDNYQNVTEKLFSRTNVILSMMQVYLEKFNNKFILEDYKVSMKDVLKDFSKLDKITHPHDICLKVVEKVGIYLGIRENLSEKLSEEFFNEIMLNLEV